MSLTLEQKYKVSLAEAKFFRSLFESEQIKLEKANKEIARLYKMYDEAIRAHAEEEDKVDELEKKVKELEEFLREEYSTGAPDWIPEYKDGKIINLPNRE